VGPVRLTLSIAALHAAKACDLSYRISDLSDHLGHRPQENEEIDLRVWLSLPSTTNRDAIWSLQAVSSAEAKRAGVYVASRSARRVEHLFPERVRDLCYRSIEAAEAWLLEPTEERAVVAKTLSYSLWMASGDYAAGAASLAADGASPTYDVAFAARAARNAVERAAWAAINAVAADPPLTSNAARVAASQAVYTALWDAARADLLSVLA
jgi:hypothetical protein